MRGPSEYAQPPDFYLPCVNVCMSGGDKEVIAKIGILHQIWMWTCMLPGELIWEGVAPPHNMV